MFAQQTVTVKLQEGRDLNQQFLDYRSDPLTSRSQAAQSFVFFILSKIAEGAEPISADDRAK